MDWHHKPCPKCGKGEIINDEDVLLFRMIQGAKRASDEINKDGKYPTASIHIDSREFRMKIQKKNVQEIIGIVNAMKQMGLTTDSVLDRIEQELERGNIESARQHLNFVDELVRRII